MGLFDTEAIILKTLRLGEADKLVTLLSDKRGILKAVAKGSRRPKSRFGSSLEPFTLCRIDLFEKKPTILMRMNGAEIIHSHRKIRDLLIRIDTASRMVRFVLALLPEGEASPGTFQLLKNGLQQLQTEKDPEWLLCAFEFKCLKLAGYHPRFEGCIFCREKVDDQPVYFSPAQGGVYCKLCADRQREILTRISPGTVSTIRMTERLDGKGLFRLRVGSSVRSELETVLDVHLSHILGKNVFERVNRTR
ncbi:MAG TPA: DNA repair protein RecO [Nitrospiria bacterium]